VFSYGRLVRVKSVVLPHIKFFSILRPVKDNVGLMTPAVCWNLRECGGVYIGQTGRSVDIRIKEHQRRIPDKSAVAEHSIDQGHRIQFHNSSICATKTRYMDRIDRDAMEIGHHPYNISRAGGFCLSKSWKPFNESLKTFQT
jgi:hypothetical protein